MKHLEYRKASLRHLTTCDWLLKSLDDTKPESNKILQNIYYLSGYIIETSLNYAFYSCINYTGEIEDHHLYNSKALKNHKFDIKINYIMTNGGDLSNLPFISTKYHNREVEKLFQNWSTDLRYCCNNQVNINKKLIENLIKEIKDINTTILRRF